MTVKNLMHRASSAATWTRETGKKPEHADRKETCLPRLKRKQISSTGG
jgi:hypothetical protein